MSITIYKKQKYHMFTAKVYKICVASASGAMKEERVAQDIVAKWNCQNGEGCGVNICT